MTERPDAGAPSAETPPGGHAPDPSGAPLHRVHLLNLPLPLLLAGQEHHDGLMREFRLLALAGQFDQSDAPVRLVQLVDILGQQYATTRDRRDEEVDAALQRGAETMDQSFDAPQTAALAARSLLSLLEDADTFCEEARLMTLPRPPLLRQFSHWYLGQVVDQIEGRPARPWDGPLRP